MKKQTAKKSDIKLEDIEIEKKAIPAFVLFVVFLVIGIAIFFFWRSKQSDRTSSDHQEQIIVATTIFPMYDFAQNVVGDHTEEISIINIIPKDSSPFNYQYSQTDQDQLNNADIVFKVGAGFDDWVDEAVTNEDVLVVDLSEVVTLQTVTYQQSQDQREQDCQLLEGIWSEEYDECTGMDETACNAIGGTFDSCASACRHNPADTMCVQVCVEVCTVPENTESSNEVVLQEWTNPYYFLSITNAKAITQEMYNYLAANKAHLNDTLYENVKNYWEELKELESIISEQAVKLPSEDIVIFDHSLDYFTQDFDIKIAGVYQDAPESNTTEEEKIELIAKINEEEIEVMFTQPFVHDAEFQNFASEMEIDVLTVYPFGGAQGINDYIGLLTHIMETLEAIDEYVDSSY